MGQGGPFGPRVKVKWLQPLRQQARRHFDAVIATIRRPLLKKMGFDKTEDNYSIYHTDHPDQNSVKSLTMNI